MYFVVPEDSSKVKPPEEVVDCQPADSPDAVVTQTTEPSDLVTEHRTAETENIQNSESYLAAFDKLAEEKRREDFPTIWAVLKSPIFILMTVWAIFCQGFILFVIGIMNSWLTWLADGDMETGRCYTIGIPGGGGARGCIPHNFFLQMTIFGQKRNKKKIGQNRLIFGQAMEKLFGQDKRHQPPPPPEQNLSRTPYYVLHES